MEIVKSVPKRLIFLSLIRIDSLDERGIYHDLLRQFVKNSYDVTVVCPVERANKIPTRVIKNSNLTILQVKTLNIQKCNVFEKGLSTLSLNFIFKRAISKYIKDNKFDLILYSTPPITLTNLISWLKTKNDAKTYLLLKDIFPQNAVDMGYFKMGGLLHRYFSKVEKKLYEISDKIGCMSLANVDYIGIRFPEFAIKLEVNPNSVDLTRIPIIKETKAQIRSRWNIPHDATVFLYGGNLGKPQGLDFLLDTIYEVNSPDIFFLIVGSGTEYSKISNWFKKNKPSNAVLLSGLPKEKFDLVLRACDVGLIFLNKNFTIPNFPSRFLSYLECKMPVIAATDPNTDLKCTIEKAHCGYWVPSGELDIMVSRIMQIASLGKEVEKMRNNAFLLLKSEYDVSISFRMIENMIS